MSKLIDLIDNTKTDKNTCHSYIETYEELFSQKKFSCQKWRNGAIAPRRR